MSTLKVNRIEPRTGDTVEIVGLDIPETPVKAWVNFNGTDVVAIRDEMNVSSITDNGVGDYTVNFETPMPDANYAVAIEGRQVAGVGNAGTSCYDQAFVKDSVRILTFQHYSQTAMDCQAVMVSAIR